MLRVRQEDVTGRFIAGIQAGRDSETEAARGMLMVQEREVPRYFRQLPNMLNKD